MKQINVDMGTVMLYFIKDGDNYKPVQMLHNTLNSVCLVYWPQLRRLNKYDESEQSIEFDDYEKTDSFMFMLRLCSL